MMGRMRVLLTERAMIHGRPPHDTSGAERELPPDDQSPTIVSLTEEPSRMETTTPALDAVLANLNTQQREAATHGMGPLLIVAGAGTGKTTTLAHRVAYVIATGVPPERILLLTFTRRAAAEMLRRVDGILRGLQRGRADFQVRRINDAADEANERSAELTADLEVRPTSLAARKVWGGTFHAVATRLLRKYGKLIGVPPGFTVLDRSDSEDVLHLIREDLKLAKGENRFPLKGTCLNIYSRAVNTQSPLKRVLEETFPWCSEHEAKLKQLFSAYVDRKEQLQVMDYDDLLLFWRALATHADAGRQLRDLFDCVLVDEYQDTNTVQADILKGLCPDGQGLTIVGDDAQSIYSFRAATVRNILDFPNQFPGTAIVKLEQNYRSTQPILAATNSVIAAAKERHKKDLWSGREQGELPQLVLCEDEDEQTQYLSERILEHRENGIPLHKQAVLFRASHHSIALEVELARRNIPFHKYGGLKFIETAHVKDLLAFLRLAENPRDVVSGTRVLVLIPGIGQAKARQLLALLIERRGDFGCWTDVPPPRAAAKDWPRLVKLLCGLADPAARKTGITGQLHRVRTFYAPLLEKKYDNARERLRDLEQLEVVSARFKDRMQFITEMTLDPPASTQELAADPLLDEDYLVLSTIHSAKGLEWDAVYVIHAADGNIPSDMATGSPEQIEEERRLFYVGLTRAKDWLYVTVPQRYYFQGRFRGDSYGYAQPTRFLTKAARKHFEQVSACVYEGDGESEEFELTSDDVRGEIKRMWS
jgi:DNA helicase-2/ATP-dependent DNA helicase PcrA